MHEQNLLNLATKVEFAKLSTSQKNAHCVSRCIDKPRHPSPKKSVDANMEENHPRDLPFDHGIKSVWKVIVSYEQREMGVLKQHNKKLNLCVRQIPEAAESLFGRLLRSNKHYAPLYIKFCMKVCDFMHAKCICHRYLSQKTSCDEKSWQ